MLQIFCAESYGKSSSLIKVPDSSEDLEVEDDEGDYGEGAGEHEAGPVDIVSDVVVSDIVDMIYLIYMVSLINVYDI